MKYLRIILLIILNQSMQGQVIDHYRYHAVNIPSNNLYKIAIDGNIDDWAWIPDQYKFRNPDFMNYEHIDSTDFNIECFVAWSEITNKIYMILKVVDNIIISSHISYDNPIRMNNYDGVTIMINPNMESGEFWAGAGYKLLFHNIISLPITPIFDPENSNLFYGTNWLQNKSYINYVTSVVENVNNTKTVYYELELNLWESLSFFSNMLSKPKVLRSDQAVGLTIAFNDVDIENYYNAIKIRTFSGSEFESHAEETSCFILDPPYIYSTLRDDLLLLNK